MRRVFFRAPVLHSGSPLDGSSPMQDALIINSRDLEFQLFEVLEAETLTQRARHSDHTRETFNAALETAHAVAAEKFAPHNRLSDEHEPQFDGQRVTMPAEVKDALDAFRSAGFLAAGKDYEWGGMQLPSVISFACLSLFKSANIATSSYAMLTTANANVTNVLAAPRRSASICRRYSKAARSAQWR